MKLRQLVVLAAFFISINSAYSQQKFAVKLNISSLGIGAEAITNLGDNINVRAGGNFFNFGINGTSDDYKYNVDTRLLTLPVYVDWYPGNSIFHLTAGGAGNLNKGNVLFIPIKNLEVNGVVFTPEQLGNITGSFNYAKFSPYFGIGLGNPLTTKGLSFSFNAGTMYQSSPEVKLNATEMLKLYDEKNTEVETTIIEKMNKFKFYPVVSFSIGYGF